MTKFLAIILVASSTGVTLACSPAPSCWYKYGPTYVRGICISYSRQHLTQEQIADVLDNPEEIRDFIKACSKLLVQLPNR